MKRVLIAIAVAAAAASLSIPAGAADVGVSISVGEPGFYGRLDIGGYPPPQVIYREPVIVERIEVERPPIYLRVPPGHAKHWHKHCYKYDACGERVLFVRDNWYSREYVPRYREQHRDHRWEDRRDERREERREERRDDHRGGHWDDNDRRRER